MHASRAVGRRITGWEDDTHVWGPTKLQNNFHMYLTDHIYILELKRIIFMHASSCPRCDTDKHPAAYAKPIRRPTRMLQQTLLSVNLFFWPRNFILPVVAPSLPWVHVSIIKAFWGMSSQASIGLRTSTFWSANLTCGNRFLRSQQAMLLKSCSLKKQ